MNVRKSLAALALSATGLLAGAAGAAEVTLYGRPHFGGAHLTLNGYTSNVTQHDFNDRASSLVVRSGRWQVCTDADFRGHCAEFVPGEYPVLDPAFNNRISSLREVGRQGRRAGEHYPERGIIKFFSRPAFAGRSLDLQEDTPDFSARRYNDRATSIIVSEGVWELCSDAGYAGHCRRFGPGRYEDLGPLSRHVSSARFLPNARRVSPEYRGDVVRAAPPWRGRDDERGPGYGRGGDSRETSRRGGADGLELYTEHGFAGQSRRFEGDIGNLVGAGFNDRARSMVVARGEWELCSDAGYRGTCMVVGPGSYASLGQLTGQLSSIRRVR